MCRSMADIQSTAAEIRRGKKEEEEDRRRKKLQGKNIMAPLLHRAAIIIIQHLYSALKSCKGYGGAILWTNSCIGPGDILDGVRAPPLIMVALCNRADHYIFMLWLKFVGVPQTPEPISAVSGPKFTILTGRVEEVLLLNKFFFSDCR